MSNDYSRVIFYPEQDYLGVLLQQGRPLTDADWNALVAQLVRRTHAGSYDTFGPAVVPETTPDGFLITPVPADSRSARDASTWTASSRKTMAPARAPGIRISPRNSARIR